MQPVEDQHHGNDEAPGVEGPEQEVDAGDEYAAIVDICCAAHGDLQDDLQYQDGTHVPLQSAMPAGALLLSNSGLSGLSPVQSDDQDDLKPFPITVSDHDDLSFPSEVFKDPVPAENAGQSDTVLADDNNALPGHPSDGKDDKVDRCEDPKRPITAETPASRPPPPTVSSSSSCRSLMYLDSVITEFLFLSGNLDDLNVNEFSCPGCPHCKKVFEALRQRFQPFSGLPMQEVAATLFEGILQWGPVYTSEAITRSIVFLLPCQKGVKRIVVHLFSWDKDGLLSREKIELVKVSETLFKYVGKGGEFDFFLKKQHAQYHDGKLLLELQIDFKPQGVSKRSGKGVSKRSGNEFRLCVTALNEDSSKQPLLENHQLELLTKIHNPHKRKNETDAEFHASSRVKKYETEKRKHIGVLEQHQRACVEGLGAPVADEFSLIPLLGRPADRKRKRNGEDGAPASKRSRRNGKSQK
ncbi:Hypothetical Protein FCC1311_070482 [Hondaea fermentalgiana]|uniref:Uncharacterized protein n=1 Tax=Hondaea fermentalgiana TaxID=2315210 RepID=A0A2R5GM66_9STRA|nr:Hypothetical Protein FCC1311_070482 [Hondaea fermentalgiana]|eukprot:GBG30828.1 Hypothetical Protein FCC1311_070482 [Hondaea fermentalgiana]